VTGVYNVEGTNPTASADPFAGGAISFQFRLAAAPELNVIFPGEGSTPECPGSVKDPRAKSGDLCIYEASSSHEGEFGFDARSPYGDALSLGSTKVAGAFYSKGTWAVTG
jgi:hypothetical protein